MSTPAGIDLNSLAAGVRKIAARHRTTFDAIAGKRSALLEYAALMLAVERYAEAGYAVAAKNLEAGKFRIKKSSNGYPWRFSWYEVSNGTQAFELLTNAKVLGAYSVDRGTYVVDVAVLEAGAIGRAKAEGRDFDGFDNDRLRTFVGQRPSSSIPCS